jgi:citrate synthase
MYGCVTAGIAALAGPLHGGANTAVMKMLLEIGEMDKVDAWVDDALAQKKKIMGIGHAVYKTEDPRATWLRKFSEQMADKKGEQKFFDMSQRIEQLMLEKKGMHPKRRFLLGVDLLPDGHPARSVHARSSPSAASQAGPATSSNNTRTTSSSARVPNTSASEV